MDEQQAANKLMADPDRVRHRAEQDGCLLIRGLMDVEQVRQVRSDVLSICREEGWLKPGTDPMEGIAAPGVAHTEREPGYMAAYNRVLKLESFYTMAHYPPLVALMDDVLDDACMVHPRSIARIVFPNNTKFTTPAHQDFVHVQGTANTWTAWIPLGDCPRELGGLAVLPGSHLHGVQPTHAAYGAGGLEVASDLGLEWATTDYAIGDALLFHSLTIHKALPNLSPDRLRLSVDYRYQPVSEPITEGSLLPHFAQVTWEEVYEGWSSKQYQYYWRDLPLTVVEWSPEYHAGKPASE